MQDSTHHPHKCHGPFLSDHARVHTCLVRLADTSVAGGRDRSTTWTAAEASSDAPHLLPSSALVCFEAPRLGIGPYPLPRPRHSCTPTCLVDLPEAVGWRESESPPNLDAKKDSLSDHDRTLGSWTAQSQQTPSHRERLPGDDSWSTAHPLYTQPLGLGPLPISERTRQGLSDQDQTRTPKSTPALRTQTTAL